MRTARETESSHRNRERFPAYSWFCWDLEDLPGNPVWFSLKSGCDHSDRRNRVRSLRSLQRRRGALPTSPSRVGRIGPLVRRRFVGHATFHPSIFRRVSSFGPDRSAERRTTDGRGDTHHTRTSVPTDQTVPSVIPAVERSGVRRGSPSGGRSTVKWVHFGDTAECPER